MKFETKYYHSQSLNTSELDLWDEFIKDNGGGYFQSASFYSICIELQGYSPFAIFTYDRGIITGSLLAVIQTNGGRVRQFLSRRAIITGGPVLRKDVKDDKTVNELLKGLNDQLRNKTIYTEFRNLFDLSGYTDTFSENGYRYHEHLNVQVELISSESVRKGISSSKLRQIKKSLKNGAEISEAKDIEEVEKFYHILKLLYQSKVKKPLPSWEFFKILYEDNLKHNHIKFLFVKSKEEILGGIIAPVYNNVIYEWYIANKDYKGNMIYPGVLTTWAALEYGLRNNLNSFDFLGAGRPGKDYGVREFKLKFGGNLVQHGRYIRINNKPLYLLGMAAIIIKKRFE